MSDDTTPGWMPPGQEPPRPSEPTLPTTPGTWAAPGSAVPEPTLPPSNPAPTAEPGPPLQSPVAGEAIGGTTPPPPPPLSGSADGGDGGDGSDGSGRSKKVLIGAVVGVLAIGAAGVFAVNQMSSDNQGGAASPEELGEAVMASLDQEDFLGVIDLLLPGERETFGEPMEEMFSELRRLEVLDDGASLDDVDGFDLVLEDRSVSVAGTNVDDIANITMRADASVSVNGEELPIGNLLLDNFSEAFEEVDSVQESESGLEFEFPVTAVEEDGRWYLSAMYSIAENARQAAGMGDIPEVGVEPLGGESPEAAIGVILDGVQELDLSAIIGGINPNEASALQRYAPLFLDEAQAALDEIPVTMEFSDMQYRISGDGDTRSVFLDAFKLHGEVRDPSGQSTETVPFDVSYADGCYTAQAEGEEVEACANEEGGLDQLGSFLAEFGADEAFDELNALYEDILSDYEQPGITVKQVDELWYVSPIATAFDQFFAVSHALDRDEIEQAAEVINRAVASVEEVYSDEFEDLVEDFPTETLPPIDTIPGDTVPSVTISEGTVPGESIPEDTIVEEFGEAEEAYSVCIQSATAQEAKTCIEQGIADGVIPDYYLPVELQFLECGLGDVYIGKVVEYDLSDEEYTTILLAANECFTALIADGSVEEYLVPPEYLRPECAESRNPWGLEGPQDGLFDRWLECIYE